MCQRLGVEDSQLLEVASVGSQKFRLCRKSGVSPFNHGSTDPWGSVGRHSPAHTPGAHGILRFGVRLESLRIDALRDFV